MEIKRTTFSVSEEYDRLVIRHKFIRKSKIEVCENCMQQNHITLEEVAILSGKKVEEIRNDLIRLRNNNDFHIRMEQSSKKTGEKP